MVLDREPRKQFSEALIDAFPKESNLEMMLSYELDWKLNQITDGGNYSEIVFNLINYAESQGKLVKLLEAAKRGNPDNYKLKEFNINVLKDDKHYQIYQALLSLNYKKQIAIFKKYWQIIPQPKVGSFLVVGESGDGQKWLVNRLLNLELLPNTTNAKKVPVSLSLKSKGIEDVWEQMKRNLNSPSASPKELIKLFYKHWQTKTVIIAIHNFDLIDIEEREQVIEKLWQPLVNKIQQHSTPCDSYLILFLVDNEGCTSDWISFTNNCNDWKNSQPIAMEPIEPFTIDVLESWMNNNKQSLNFPEEPEELQELAQNFWRKARRGIPETVMNNICEYCDYNWSEVSKRLPV